MTPVARALLPTLGLVLVAGCTSASPGSGGVAGLPARAPDGSVVVGTDATSNVSIDASSDGRTVAVAWYDYDPATKVERAFVATSRDGGATFGRPVVVYEPSIEYPEVAVLDDGGILVGATTYDLDALVDADDPLSWPGWAVLYRSNDGGSSFSKLADLRALIGDRVLALGQPSSMAASPDGRTIVLAWQDHTAAAFVAPGDPAPVEGTEATPVWASVSLDGGRTFAAPQLASGSTCNCCRVEAFVADGLAGVGYRGLEPIDADTDERDMGLTLADERGRFGAPVEIHDDGFRMPLAGCPASGPGIEGAGGALHAAWWTSAKGREGWWYARGDTAGSFDEPISLPAPFSITYSLELALDARGDPWIAASGHPEGDGELLVWHVADGEAELLDDIRVPMTISTSAYDIAGVPDGAIVAWHSVDGDVLVRRREVS